MALEYKTIVNNDKNIFDKDINLAINNGYSLQGGLSITIENDHVWYGQVLFINNNYNNYITSTTMYYVINTQNNVVNWIVGKNLSYIQYNSVYVESQNNSENYFTGIVENYNTITGDIKINAEIFFGSFDISSIFTINQNYYISSTINSYLIDTSVNNVNFIVGKYLAYVTNDSLLIVDVTNSNNYFIGTVISYESSSGKIYLFVSKYIGTYEIPVIYKINKNEYITTTMQISNRYFDGYVDARDITVNIGLAYEKGDSIILTTYDAVPSYYLIATIVYIPENFGNNFDNDNKYQTLRIDLWPDPLNNGPYIDLFIITYNKYTTETTEYIVDTTKTVQNFKVNYSLEYNFNDPVIVNDLDNENNFFIGEILNYNSYGDIQINVQLNNYFGTFGSESKYSINYNYYTTKTIIKYLLNKTINIVNFIVGIGFNYSTNDPVLVRDINNELNYFFGTIIKYNKIYGNMEIAVIKYYGIYDEFTNYIVEFNNYLTNTTTKYLIDTTLPTQNFIVGLGLSYKPNIPVACISQEFPDDAFSGKVINYNSKFGNIEILVDSYSGLYTLPSIFTLFKNLNID
jgi:hypothetical protein